MKVVIVAIVLIALALIITNPFDNNRAIETPLKGNQEQPRVENEPEKVEDESTGTPNSDTGKYIGYDKTKLTSNQNVIFFAASWCPTCRTLDQSINTELDSIPSNLTILKADYDKEIELRKKYGVTYQHTLVQVDKDGNQIAKWNGSRDIAEIISELK